MCGIAGWFAFKPEAPGLPTAAQLGQAVLRLRHRGPDHQNQLVAGRVGLGHARLSILDLSTGAHQPMLSPDGRYAIVFNGEVFNHQALAEMLQRRGVHLHTRSDTEVLLQLFIQEGRNCLPMLNGFFAFAIYDREEQSLFLARDRYGIKPLYLHQDAVALRFGSELGALAALGMPYQIDQAALACYFRLNYLPPHSSLVRQVQQLPPGHFAYLQHNTMLVEQWYRLPLAPTQPEPGYTQAQEKLLLLLEDAVKQRLVADVPVGVFLSGGIDSSSITALAARHTSHLHTFSIGFEDKLYDETPYAQAVARMYRTEHTVFTLGAEDLYAELDDMLNSLQEPFADASALNLYLLSRRTKEHVTVALSGDGADELFGGYSKHLGEVYSRQGSLRNKLLRSLSPVLQRLPAHRHSARGRRLYQLQRYAAGLRRPPAERYLAWAAVAEKDWVAKLLVQPADEAELLAPYVAHFSPAGDLNEVLGADMQLVLGGDMLVKTDRMSMAHGLEVRVPFLDYRVVDYVMGLPVHYKVLGQQRKRLLQDAMRPLLPPQLYNRPKQGFEVPLRSWYLGPMRSYIEQKLLDEEALRAQGLFHIAPLRQLWQRIVHGQSTREEWTLWAFIVFQHWHRRTLATQA
ncbi:MAG: asparagine synthase (glutamine-hydrolyzing) [Bacteroidetes bacterium]|jgi:asparagine synthase (glutamine-hydrolysing)|nr:asparagine synthase (glutamine-hydrolyzing) [Bacteroidota bacterium]